MSKRRIGGSLLLSGCAALWACGEPTTTTVTSETACATPAQDANVLLWEAQVVELVNTARAQGAHCGQEGDFAAQPALVGNALLNCVARTQSEAMASQNFFSHTDPDGSTPAQRVTAAGYRWSAMGENIAAGVATAERVMQEWMESPGHCANIMSPNFSQLGVGFYRAKPGTSTYEYYWTQEFASPARR